MESAVTCLRFDDRYYEWLQNKYTHMKNLFTDGLRDLGLTFTEPQGAYYVLVDISEFGYEDDTEFCLDLIRKVGDGCSARIELLPRKHKSSDTLSFCKTG